MFSLREEIEAIKKKVDVYLGMGRFDSAEKLLKSALKDFGPIANLQNLLGLIYHRQSRFPEAVDLFRQSVETNPKFIEGILNLAATLCDLSEYDEAQKVFELARQGVSPSLKLPDTMLGRLANQHARLGRLYEENGMITDAIREYRKALSMYHHLPDVKLALGRILIHSGKIDDAKVEFEELARMDPNSTSPRIWLGVAYYRLGLLDLARQQWDIAGKMSPFDLSAKAMMRIASFWVETNRLKP